MPQHIFESSGGPVSAPPGVGHHWVDTTAKLIYESVGTSSVDDWKQVRAASSGSAVFTLQLPVAGDNTGGVFFRGPSLITRMQAVLRGSASPSVTWTIKHSTDRSAAGTEVVTGGTTTTSTTTGDNVSSLNNPTIPTNGWLWLAITAQSGTVDEISITIFFE